MRKEDQARGVVERLASLEPIGAFRERGNIGLCVDATGVGRAGVDMLKHEIEAIERRLRH